MVSKEKGSYLSKRRKPLPTMKVAMLLFPGSYKELIPCLKSLLFRVQRDP